MAKIAETIKTLKLAKLPKLKQTIQDARRSEFLRHNAIFFVGSIAISVLNYLYYPVLGRLLEPAAFGEVQTVISIYLQAAIFLTVLGLITVNIVANHGDEPDAQRTVFELEKLALAVGLASLLLTVALGPLLQDFFKFGSTVPFVLLAVTLAVSIPTTFRSSYLRAKKKFGLNSLSGIIASAAKLLLSALFVVMGWGTTGAILGLVVSQCVSFAFTAYKAQQAGFGHSLRQGIWKLPDMKLVLPELKYALLVLAGSLAITVLYSIDIIAVKHYFDAHTAGLYAGIATVARIIFFLTGSISQVLLPSVKLSNPPGANRQVLKKSAILLTGLGLPALAVFWFLPELVIKLLMGGSYAAYAPLLPRLSLVVFIVSVLNLLLLYFIALRRYSVSIIAIISIVVTCGLVVIRHHSPQAVVDSMLLGVLASAGLLVAWVGMNYLRSNANVIK